jgi:hypothetical protein
MQVICADIILDYFLFRELERIVLVHYRQTSEVRFVLSLPISCFLFVINIYSPLLLIGLVKVNFCVVNQ